MKLDNFKNSPISIVSFIVLTFLFSYLIIGNLEIAGVTTILSTWIFMMPRLTFENSMYQKKLPNFLKKGDFLNKIIGVLIPIIFWGIYAFTMQNATLFTNPWLGLAFVIMPIIPAGVQYAILTRSDSATDWVCPFVMAILTFFASEFLAGTLGTMFQAMFPFIFKSPIVITQLWSILLEILTIYAFYRIVSILIPSRTISATFTTLLWMFIGVLQNVYMSTIGMSFKISDVFKIKQFIASLKILFLNNGLPASLIVQAVGLVAAITIIVFVLNKWSTVYDFKERLRGWVVGVAVFATCVFCFGYTNVYANKNNLDVYKGISFNLITEFNQKNEFPESFMELVNQEMIDKGWAEATPEETAPTETTPTETETPETTTGETTPSDSEELVPPPNFGDE